MQVNAWWYGNGNGNGNGFGYGNVNDNDGNSHDKYVDSIDLTATTNFIFLKGRLSAEEWGPRAEGKGKPRP